MITACTRHPKSRGHVPGHVPYGFFKGIPWEKTYWALITFREARLEARAEKLLKIDVTSNPVTQMGQYNGLFKIRFKSTLKGMHLLWGMDGVGWLLCGGWGDGGWLLCGVTL